MTKLLNNSEKETFSKTLPVPASFEDKMPMGGSERPECMLTLLDIFCMCDFPTKEDLKMTLQENLNESSTNTHRSTNSRPALKLRPIQSPQTQLNTNSFNSLQSPGLNMMPSGTNSTSNFSVATGSGI